MREFFSFTHTDGPMDEWFSHRSAKPSTAVRIRFGPQKTLLQALVEGFLVFYALFYAPFTLDYHKS